MFVTSQTTGIKKWPSSYRTPQILQTEAEPAQNFGRGQIFSIYASKSIWIGTPRLEAQNDKIC